MQHFICAIALHFYLYYCYYYYYYYYYYYFRSPRTKNHKWTFTASVSIELLQEVSKIRKVTTRYTNSAGNLQLPQFPTHFSLKYIFTRYIYIYIARLYTQQMKIAYAYLLRGIRRALHRCHVSINRVLNKQIPRIIQTAGGYQATSCPLWYTVKWV